MNKRLLETILMSTLIAPGTSVESPLGILPRRRERTIDEALARAKERKDKPAWDPRVDYPPR